MSPAFTTICVSRRTQRIDEAFIGRSSDPEDRRNIGVGLAPGYPHPATLTNINEDFNKNTAEKKGWKINDFSKPIILVIKKNVTTLTALHKWLKELNAEGDGRISDVPMLLIDDEADNASINTNKEDLDPTRTNAMIRRILGLFAKSCYVGYTATPFANIFINPDAYGDDVREAVPARLHLLPGRANDVLRCREGVPRRGDQSIDREADRRLRESHPVRPQA